MAGACAQVLIPQQFSDTDRRKLESYIQSTASFVEGNSFWVAGQPFIWYEELVDDDTHDRVVLGWNPKYEIGFCAMCRGPVAEAYLAMLVARVAQMFGGVVAFGNHIARFASDVILVADGRFEYEDQDYLTPEFLHQWIHHPNFRMVN